MISLNAAQDTSKVIVGIYFSGLRFSFVAYFAIEDQVK
jgi:hypothetical protein